MSQKLYLFSIKDHKAKSFLPPFILPNINMAVRSFGGCLVDTGHQFCHFPSDYSLYCLGEFDSDSGNIDVNTPDLIINGRECKDAHLKQYAVEISGQSSEDEENA